MTAQIYNAGGQIVTPDIYFQIGMNMIPDMGSFAVSGVNPLVRSDWETVWPTGGLYVWPNTANFIQAFSSSSQDQPGQPGAHEITIRGLDADWNVLEETITLNGTLTSNTTNDFLRVNSVRVISAGSTGANVGTISLNQGEADPIQTIEPQYNSSRAAIVSTPAGYAVGILGYYASLFAPSQVSLAEVALLAHRENQPYSVLSSDILPNPGDIDHMLRVPYLLPEKTDLEVITVTDTGNRDSTIAAGFSGIFVGTSYSLSTEPVGV